MYKPAPSNVIHFFFVFHSCTDYCPLVPLSAPIPSLGTAVSRLSERLSQLTTSHAKNSSTLTSLAQERQEVEEREKEMREMVEKAEEKRAWFTDFKDWTESVAGFLDEKVCSIEIYLRN